MAQGYDYLLEKAAGISAEYWWVKLALAEWKHFKSSKARNSIWKTYDGQLIRVCDLKEEHINNILNAKFFKPLPVEWRKLLKGELLLRHGIIEKLEKQLKDWTPTIQVLEKCDF